MMVAGKRSWGLASGALALSALLSWVGAELLPASRQTASPAASEHPPAVAKTAQPAVPVVTTLHEQATSAYHARLFVDEDGVVVITQTGFTTIRAEGAAEEHAVALGPVAVRQGGAVVFWRSGKLRAVSLSGDDERELAVVPRVPQFLLASPGQLAWIHTDRQTGTSLQTLSAGEVRSVHASEDGVTAAVLHGAAVYWVSERRDGSWAITRVGLDGQPPKSTEAHRGRPPAMLAVGREGLYFYGGLESGVRKLTFDLEQEAALLTRAVCSPLAVSTRVVCAHVGGLFDLSAAKTPRPLVAERSGPITALAATDERVYWVAENGAERLVVRSLPLLER